MPNEVAKWRRLSISDFLVITCAVALGFSLVVASHRGYQENHSMRERWRPTAPNASVFVLGAVVGLQLAAPMIVATQFLLRGRRRFLSGQELLWLTPLVMYAVIFVASHVLVVLLGLQAIWLVALFFLAIFVSGCFGGGLLLVHIVEATAGPDGPAAWYWGDYLGCLSCIAAASYALWEIGTGLRIDGL